jgi:hypothetical protein
MITVNSLEEANGKWVTDEVKLLGVPYKDESTGQWRALANAYGMLAIVELRLHPIAPKEQT